MELTRIEPSDVAMTAVLAVVCTVIACTLGLSPALGLHAALLAGFVLLLAGVALGKVPRWVTVLASVFLVVTLYTSVGQLSFVVQGRDWDALLSSLDHRLFGIDQAHLFDGWISRAGVELMSFFYLLHLASIYIALGVHALRTRDAHRERFLFGLVMTYGVSYLLYLLVPAHGPVAHHAAEYAAPLQGYRIHRVMQQVVDAGGGAIGAFPSLHVGGTLFLFLFDLRHDRFRAATYWPVVIGVALSTSYLRFHYVVDWIGGAAVAGLAILVTPGVSAAWERLRAPKVSR